MIGQNCDDEAGLCLGVVNGLLADCPQGGGVPACVSSQDDAAGGGKCFAPPWEYDGSAEEALEAVRGRVLDFRAGISKDWSVELVREETRYLRVRWRNGKTGAVDDGEFFFPENDDTVQIRAARRGNLPDFGENAKRMEAIRKSLRFDQIPVVRNRRRALVVVESPFDTFGPGAGVEGDKDPEGLEKRYETDPLAPPWQPPTKAMKQLKNERAQLDDLIFPFNQ